VCIGFRRRGCRTGARFEIASSPPAEEGSVCYLHPEGVRILSVLVDANKVALLEEEDDREAEQHGHRWEDDEVAELRGIVHKALKRGIGHLAGRPPVVRREEPDHADDHWDANLPATVEQVRTSVVVDEKPLLV